MKLALGRAVKLAIGIILQLHFTATSFKRIGFFLQYEIPKIYPVFEEKLGTEADYLQTYKQNTPRRTYNFGSQSKFLYKNKMEVLLKQLKI